MKKAFSLIELSIVVVLVGLLIAAATQGGKIVRQVKLKTARALTQSSPVASAADLVVWYETSLESSFGTSALTDGDSIATWYDNNPHTNDFNNATQSTSGYQPKFYENIFNGGIPGVNFDGVDDYMSFSGLALVGSNYTIFVVDKAKEPPSAPVSYFISGGHDGDVYTCLDFGYLGDPDTTGETQDIILTNKSNGLFFRDMFTISTATMRIHTGMFDSTVGKSYWLNGGNTADASDSQTGALVSYDETTIGAYRYGSATDYAYYGDIAEIIIFSRALRTEERQLIELYLSKKYGINLS